MSEREHVLLELGFVLHQRPYRNTSQLLECTTAEHGRVGLIARGSRRTNSRQRALLQPFVPLRLSWLRRGELGQLTHVEPAAARLDLRDGGGAAAVEAHEADFLQAAERTVEKLKETVESGTSTNRQRFIFEYFLREIFS